jgi:hypothetical protein
MLTEEGSIEPFDSLDSDGSPTFGALTAGVAMRVEEGVEVAFVGEGSREDVMTVVWIDQSVSSDDRIHLPDGSVLDVKGVQKIPTTDGRVSIWKAAG